MSYASQNILYVHTYVVIIWKSGTCVCMALCVCDLQVNHASTKHMQRFEYASKQSVTCESLQFTCM